MIAASGPLRALIALRACLGATLLAAPRVLLGDLPHQRIDRTACVFARMLGARHLLEAAVLARRHTHGWLLLGAAVDATHSLSMLALARLRPDRRELALSNAAMAAVLAGQGVAYALRAAPERPR
jgi:hypothetical protein